MHHTPLRYPGGKRRLYDVVKALLNFNGLSDIQYVEPFAGGAAVAISLLFDEFASTIHLNDLSRPVYAFWHTLLNDTTSLCKRVEDAKLSISEWRRHREILRQEDSAEIADLGFSALYLNRTNRSGIIRGGVIGGQQQDGKWKIDARFNKATIVSRIKKIARYRDRIKLYQMDGHAFATKLIPKLKNAFVFFDPPYIERSRLLYLNTLRKDDHERLAISIKALRAPWIATYDCPAIKLKLFPSQRRIVYGLYYMAQRKRSGEEVMFFSDGLHLPRPAELFGPRFRVLPRQSRLK